MKSKIFISALLIFSISLRVKAQVDISNTGEIDKIKNGTTYIVMKNPDDPSSKAFADVYEKYWTFSKIKIIKSDDIGNYLAPENSFFTISGIKKTIETQRANFTTTNSYRVYIYLELWTCKDKFFNRNKKDSFTMDDANEVARIELYVDYKTVNDPKLINDYNYDGEGHIYNWGPGILKNYLQQLMACLNEGKSRNIGEEIVNKDELQNLRGKTLFIPEYVLFNFREPKGNSFELMDAKEILGDYKFKYQVISIDELNDKILKENAPLYYLIYIQSTAHKFINVINSKTGEVVYSKTSSMSYRIKSDDLKDLYKKAAK